jgi:lipid-A-disaccharide synthase-like uncharacterized protein
MPLAPLLIFVTFFAAGFCAAAAGSAPPGESGVPDQLWTPAGHVRVSLDGFYDNVRLVRLANGEERFLVQSTRSREIELLTGEELLQLLKSQAAHRTWAHRFFQASGAAGFVWVAIGLAGQVLFAGRMIVQWLVSERSRRSVVPVAFWWISLAGASMLLLYFLWRKDVVGILGQTMGWLIYVRNLVLIYRESSGAAGER